MVEDLCREVVVARQVANTLKEIPPAQGEERSDFFVDPRADAAQYRVDADEDDRDIQNLGERQQAPPRTNQPPAFSPAIYLSPHGNRMEARRNVAVERA